MCPQYLALSQINCETDFVARNDGFRNLVTSVAASALHVSLEEEGAASPSCRHLPLWLLLCTSELSLRSSWVALRLFK